MKIYIQLERIQSNIVLKKKRIFIELVKFLILNIQKKYVLCLKKILLKLKKLKQYFNLFFLYKN